VNAAVLPESCLLPEFCPVDRIHVGLGRDLLWPHQLQLAVDPLHEVGRELVLLRLLVVGDELDRPPKRSSCPSW